MTIVMTLSLPNLIHHSAHHEGFAVYESICQSNTFIGIFLLSSSLESLFLCVEKLSFARARARVCVCAHVRASVCVCVCVCVCSCVCLCVCVGETGSLPLTSKVNMLHDYLMREWVVFDVNVFAT